VDTFDAIYQRRAVTHYDREHELTDAIARQNNDSASHDFFLAQTRFIKREVVPLDQFAPQNADILWRFDTNAYRVSLDLDNGDLDVVANVNYLTFLAAKDQHFHFLHESLGISWVERL
jgi:hypothetical protein